METKRFYRSEIKQLINRTAPGEEEGDAEKQWTSRRKMLFFPVGGVTDSFIFVCSVLNPGGVYDQLGFFAHK